MKKRMTKERTEPLKRRTTKKKTDEGERELKSHTKTQPNNGGSTAMPKSTLKLTLSDATDFSPLPDDTYPATISDVGDIQKGPKANYVRVTFKISEGEYEGRKFFSNYMVDGAAAGMFIDLINKATGSDLKVDDLREDGFELDPADIIDASVAIVLKQREYPEGSGEMRSEVKSVLAA
jgi:hypothetical protein